MSNIRNYAATLYLRTIMNIALLFYRLQTYMSVTYLLSMTAFYYSKDFIQNLNKDSSHSPDLIEVS